MLLRTIRTAMLYTAGLIMAALLLAALAPTLTAQTTPVVTYNSIRTPEIQLGSGTQPTTVTEYPVLERSSAPSAPPVDNAPPANLDLLATRHFDFIVSPVSEFPAIRGNLADTSISLGDYARQLRAQKSSNPW